MAIQVKLPDGSIGEFPDGTPDTTIEQTLSAQFGAPDRNRRATGDQAQPGSPPPLPETEPDPLSGVAVEINGIKLTPEERTAIAEAKTLDDPKEKRLIAARLAGRIAQRGEGGNWADELQRNGVGAAMRGFVNMFGIGDIAGATGMAVSSDIPFADALELQREFRRAGEEKYPITSTAAEIAGAVTGAGGIAKGANLATKGTKLAPIVEGLTGFKEGQSLRNVAKASALGATEGAITEGVTEDNAGGGALIGAAGGPAGLALAKTLGVAVPVFIKGLEKARLVTPQSVRQDLVSSGSKGLKILADKIGEPVEDLMLRFQQYKALTGKPPSIAELTNKNASQELRRIIEQSGDATRTAQDLAETNLSTRAKEIGKNITGGGEKTTKSGLELARDTEADKLFALSHKEDIPFAPEQVEQVLHNPDLRDAIPKSLRREIDDAIEGAGSGEVTLKGKTLDDLRQALGEKVGRGYKTRFADLYNQVQDIGRAGSSKYGDALDAYAKASQRIEGQQLGNKVLQGETGEFTEQIGQATRTTKKAAAGGARTALKDRASEDLTGAKTLVDKLTTESGLVTRLKKIIPAQELDLIRQTARAQRDSIDNLVSTTPRTVKKGVQDDVLPTLVNAIVALSPSTSAASKAFATGRMGKILQRVTGGAIDDRVLKNLAQDIFDPEKSEAVLQVLRRAGASDADIVEALVTSAGGASALQQVTE